MEPARIADLQLFETLTDRTSDPDSYAVSLPFGDSFFWCACSTCKFSISIFIIKSGIIIKGDKWYKIVTCNINNELVL